VPSDCLDKELLELKAKLRGLKDRGDAVTKGFGESLKDHFIEFKDWVIGYCREETPFGLQPTVSVSRRDGSKFRPTDVGAQLAAGIKGVFPGQVLYSGLVQFPNRGCTLMVIISPL